MVFIPSFVSSLGSPIPLLIRIIGELNEPEDKIISLFANEEIFSPFLKYSIPIAFFPSNMTLLTVIFNLVIKFFLLRAGWR